MGKGEKHSSALYTTSLFLLDVKVSATGYLTHINVYATTLSDSYERTALEEKKRIKREKKKTELTNVCAGQGADVLGFSLDFVFKRQSTVKTKQNRHVVSFDFLS